MAYRRSLKSLTDLKDTRNKRGEQQIGTTRAELHWFPLLYSTLGQLKSYFGRSYETDSIS